MSFSGVTSGIDLAMAMVEEDWGRKVALSVAQYLVVFVKRPGGQSQFSAYIATEASRRPDLRDLQAWIMGHPTQDLGVEILADRMAMSPRNFARAFLSETGMTPAKFVEMARIDAARQHLVNSEPPIDVVADKSGFRHPEQMRRAFLHLLGVNPHDYRARFSSHHERGSESRSGGEQGKLAAIMFTDMVGYNALAQRDEGLALELLEEHRAFLRPAFLKRKIRQPAPKGLPNRVRSLDCHARRQRPPRRSRDLLEVLASAQSNVYGDMAALAE
jgi:AraC-like DNA-binding protein